MALCLKPISLTKTKVSVPCGRCFNCLQRKRSHWSIRMQKELETAENATFLTLTYDDDNLPYTEIIDTKKTGSLINLRKADPVTQYLHNLHRDSPEAVTQLINEINNIPQENIQKLKSILKRIPTLKKKDLQDYFKRVRKSQPNLKYYAVGEYGTKGKRPHYHAIVFNAEPLVLLDKWSTFDRKNQCWTKKGRVQCDSVTANSIHYVTKYIINHEPPGHKSHQRPFSICSKGMGINYISTHGNYHRSNLDIQITSKGGTKVSIPRYYKEKIFTDEAQKEAIKTKINYIASLNEEKMLSETAEYRNEQKIKFKLLAEKQSKSSDV